MRKSTEAMACWFLLWFALSGCEQKATAPSQEAMNPVVAELCRRAPSDLEWETLMTAREPGAALEHRSTAQAEDFERIKLSPGEILGVRVDRRAVVRGWDSEGAQWIMLRGTFAAAETHHGVMAIKGLLPDLRFYVVRHAESGEPLSVRAVEFAYCDDGSFVDLTFAWPSFLEDERKRIEGVFEFEPGKDGLIIYEYKRP